MTRTLPMLVVEDDPGNRDVLARAFQAEGFTVVSVASGQEAIARATESPPAVVLLDLLLPDLDPLEIVQGVRRAGTNPVVVVVSAAPNVRELVSIRIDRAVLDHFQEDGPGWQDRINHALRQLVADKPQR